MDIIIVTRFHHGGKFVEGTSGGGLTYIGESEVEYVGIDKDHFSLMELLFYTRDLGYVTVGGFYFKDPTINNFVLVDNDFSLLNLIKDLGDGDFLDLYVQHVVDEVEVIKDGVPTGYLCGPTVGENVNEDGVKNSHNINLDERAQSENINVEVGVDDASDLEGVETDWNISDDSQEFAIPDDDDSEIDEELRTLRNERRTKLQRKKPVPIEEIILGVVGVDRGFEDIGRNKAARRVQQAGRGRGRGRGKGRGIGGDDTSTVTGRQQAGRGRGREGVSTSTGGNKRPKTVGFGTYTDDISGRQTLNPGTTGERVVTPVVFKCATPTNIDIGYKPRGLKWKGKDAITTPQLQRMSRALCALSASWRGIPILIQQSEYTRGDEQLCANENLKMPPRRGDEQYDRLMNNLSPFLLPKSVQQKHKTTNTITLRLLT
uniref:Gag-pol polyprotein n=1 Tax=Solanum tuberosum TaxID=4113 RepID=M1BHL2_SOLTU